MDCLKTTATMGIKPAPVIITPTGEHTTRNFCNNRATCFEGKRRKWLPGALVAKFSWMVRKLQ